MRVPLALTSPPIVTTDDNNLIGYCTRNCTGILLAAAGDLIAQTAENESLFEHEQPSSSAVSDTRPKSLAAAFIWERFVGFVAFGALVKGGAQHVVYGYLIPRCGPRWVQFLCDQLGWGPLGYYPLYYVVSGHVEHGRGAAESVALYASEASTVLPVYYSFWGPVQVQMEKTRKRHRRHRCFSSPLLECAARS